MGILFLQNKVHRSSKRDQTAHDKKKKPFENQTSSKRRAIGQPSFEKPSKTALYKLKEERKTNRVYTEPRNDFRT